MSRKSGTVRFHDASGQGVYGGPGHGGLSITCTDGRHKVTDGLEVDLTTQWTLSAHSTAVAHDIVLAFCASERDISDSFRGRFENEIFYLRDAVVEPSRNPKRAASTTVPSSPAARANLMRELAFDETAYLKAIPAPGHEWDSTYVRVSRAMNGGSYHPKDGKYDGSVIMIAPGQPTPAGIRLFTPSSDPLAKIF